MNTHGYYIARIGRSCIALIRKTDNKEEIIARFTSNESARAAYRCAVKAATAQAYAS